MSAVEKTFSKYSGAAVTFQRYRLETRRGRPFLVIDWLPMGRKEERTTFAERQDGSIFGLARAARVCGLLAGAEAFALTGERDRLIREMKAQAGI